MARIMLGRRSAKRVMAALWGRQHYIALLHMARVYPGFAANLWRYLTGRGSYPYQPVVRTPLGPIRPTLYTHHDLLTLNEIFCRRDYAADQTSRIVVDLGSNIGISALYFLTRSRESRCLLFEPDARNIARLKENLAGHEDRYELHEFAVADQRGEVTFGIEPTGRYGGIGRNTGDSIRVPCRHINDVLESVLKRFERIDILKIDTEGVEIATVKAIDPAWLPRVEAIYLEAAPDEPLWPAFYIQKQYGSICRLMRR